MTPSVIPPDNDARQQALDVKRSFIVQAPAGSGKTELLTQRFLALLATVERPEQILALTFTRKAAAEMRHRILTALIQASLDSPVESNHAKITRRLAKMALQRDEMSKWQLLQNPNRLRIQTIDALCAHLTNLMPILARSGPSPKIADDPTLLYQLAAERFLQLDQKDHPWTSALSKILLHLDNDHPRVQRLFVAMLAIRDQWLSHIVTTRYSEERRALLEEALQHVTLDSLTKLVKMIPKALITECLDLGEYAALHCQNPAFMAFSKQCSDVNASLDSLPVWLGIVELLLTKSGTFRKRVDVSIGFKPASAATSSQEKILFAEQKKRISDLLSHLSDDTVLEEALSQLRECPSIAYTDAQWEIIDALLECLPVLCAQLKVIFTQRSVVDFTEISLNAIHALGSFDEPSDLQLRFDHHLHHLLIDEFQDTSNSQNTLISLLTSEWPYQEGRSLFLVGDPMQSIYRFRQAEVGLFLKACTQGLNQYPLTFLKLTANFRSAPDVVEWNNRIFSSAFPRKSDITLGAIPYSPSVAIKNNSEEVGVFWAFSQSQSEQAEKIVADIKAIRDKDSLRSIAILVRSRSHLNDLLPLLEHHQLSYQAVELERLQSKPLVRDLFTLTRALLHPADRIAWLSLLRAPWCGLTLADLHALVNDTDTACIWDLMQEDLTTLSTDGQQRIARIQAILKDAIVNRRRQPLHQIIYNVWLQLGSTHCYLHANSQDARTYFSLLQAIEKGGDIADIDYFDQKLEEHFANVEVSDHNPIKIMTIHKAKGLEFDDVFLLCLERQPRNSSDPLLRYSEAPRESGESDLILAPIKSALSEEDPIYNYLKKTEQHRAMLETTRLFYVAATRAKQRLFCYATLNIKEDGSVRAPSPASLLGQIWPAIEAEVTKQGFSIDKTHSLDPLSELIKTKATLHRLPNNFKNSMMNSRGAAAEMNDPDPLLYQWHSSVEQAAGTLLHQTLHWICKKKLQSFSISDSLKKHWRNHLKNNGYENHEVSQGLDLIERALNNLLKDQRGQWILFGDFTESHSEFAIHYQKNERILTLRIDRTFVDDKNQRWIVDYKLSHDKEVAHYQQQLHQYAEALSQMDDRRIQLGLYFPLSQDWIEWHWRKQSS